MTVTTQTFSMTVADESAYVLHRKVLRHYLECADGMDLIVIWKVSIK